MIQKLVEVLQHVITVLKRKIKPNQDTGLVDYLDTQSSSDSIQATADTGRPYTNLSITRNCIIREFTSDVDAEELVWHQDDEERVVTVLEVGEGWQFQYDNELPWVLEVGSTLFIERHEWHRVIKGTGNLVIKIDIN